jgi:Fur family ferric uptake transcriptional regulator
VASVEGVLATLRARGGRATSARRVLLEVLFHAESHLTAEELAATVQQRAPGVHISTIYRSLDELQQLGVIVHSHLGHGPATYQLTSLAHAHFICERCGATVEAPDELFRGLARTARDKLGFAIDPLHFAMLGRCATCSAPAPTRRAGGHSMAPSVPHPSRLALDNPRRREILARHRAAVRSGADSYEDPTTGLAVFTSACLAQRGTCCGSGCRHCPYLTTHPRGD